MLDPKLTAMQIKYPNIWHDPNCNSVFPEYWFCNTLDYINIETDNKQIMQVMVPGIKKENISINIQDSWLHIKVKTIKCAGKVTYSKVNPSTTLALFLSGCMLLSYPKVTLQDGVLELSWDKTPSFKLDNIELKF